MMPQRQTVSAAEAVRLLKPRRSKYGVDLSEAGRASRTYGGRTYHSKAERQYAELLDVRKLAGDIKLWWPQQTIPLLVNGVVICKYIADFKILHNDSSIEYIEIKGCSTGTWRLKRALFQALYPKQRLTVIPSRSVAA